MHWILNRSSARSRYYCHSSRMSSSLLLQDFSSSRATPSQSHCPTRSSFHSSHLNRNQNRFETATMRRGEEMKGLTKRTERSRLVSNNNTSLTGDGCLGVDCAFPFLLLPLGVAFALFCFFCWFWFCFEGDCLDGDCFCFCFCCCC